MVDGSINNPSNEEGEEANNSSNIQEFRITRGNLIQSIQSKGNQKDSTSPGRAHDNSNIPFNIQYLIEKGYNTKKDVLDVMGNPDTVYKKLTDLTKRIEKDITTLVNITETNWNTYTPVLIKIIRKEWESCIFKDAGLDFVLRNIILKMLPGEKGASFIKNMNHSKLERILEELEGSVDIKDHQLKTGIETLKSFKSKHTLDDKTITKVSEFVDLLNSFKTDEKKLIFLLQATCKPEGGLPNDWFKETSLTTYLQKVRLRKFMIQEQREGMVDNDVYTKKVSKRKSHKLRKHKKSEKNKIK